MKPHAKHQKDISYRCGTTRYYDRDPKCTARGKSSRCVKVKIILRVWKSKIKENQVNNVYNQINSRGNCVYALFPMMVSLASRPTLRTLLPWVLLQSYSPNPKSSICKFCQMKRNWMHMYWYIYIFWEGIT